MKRMILLVVSLTVMLHAQEFTLETYKKTFEQAQQSLLAQYGKNLDVILLDLKNKGDLTNYLLVEAEKKRFDNEKTLLKGPDPKMPYQPAVKTYDQGLTRLQDQYIKVLDEYVKKSVKAGRIDEAKAAKDVKDGLVPLMGGQKEKTSEEVQKPAEDLESAPVKPTILATLFTTYSKDLVLLYSFDKNQGSMGQDASKNKLDGRVQGAKFVQDGKVGGAALFTGSNSRVVVAHDDPLMLGNKACTVGAWIKNYGSTHTYQSIFSKGSNPGFALRLGASPDRVLEYFKSAGGNYSFFTSSKTITDANWHHVVVVDLGNGTVEFYLDGALVDTVKKQNYNTDTLEDGAVGGLANAGYGQWFNGVIDELFIFKRALTKSDIKRLYDQQNKE